MFLNSLTIKNLPISRKLFNMDIISRSRDLQWRTCGVTAVPEQGLRVKSKVDAGTRKEVDEE